MDETHEPGCPSRTTLQNSDPNLISMHGIDQLTARRATHEQCASLLLDITRGLSWQPDRRCDGNHHHFALDDQIGQAGAKVLHDAEHTLVEPQSRLRRG